MIVPDNLGGRLRRKLMAYTRQRNKLVLLSLPRATIASEKHMTTPLRMLLDRRCRDSRLPEAALGIRRSQRQQRDLIEQAGTLSIFQTSS